MSTPEELSQRCRSVLTAFSLVTRFVAVRENIASSDYKQAITDPEDADTVMTCRKLLPTRSLKTEFSSRLLELEASGASADEIRQFLGYRRARLGQLERDLDNGEAYCGTSAGLIKEILPAARVIPGLADGYHEVIEELA